MKKVLQQLLVLPIITLLGVLVNAIFPPSTGSGQQLPPDKRPVQDSTISLEKAKEIISTAERNSAIIKGIEAGKKAEVKTGPVPKVIIKPVPVVKTRVDTVYRDSVIEKKVIVYKTAPIYRTAEIKYLTFSQWRDSTGLKSEKQYKEYLKTKFK